MILWLINLLSSAMSFALLAALLRPSKSALFEIKMEWLHRRCFHCSDLITCEEGVKGMTQTIKQIITKMWKFHSKGEIIHLFEISSDLEPCFYSLSQFVISALQSRPPKPPKWDRDFYKIKAINNFKKNKKKKENLSHLKWSSESQRALIGALPDLWAYVAFL